MTSQSPESEWSLRLVGHELGHPAVDCDPTRSGRVRTLTSCQWLDGGDQIHISTISNKQLENRMFLIISSLNMFLEAEAACVCNESTIRLF